MTAIKRFLAPALALAVVAVMAYVVFGGGDKPKTLTAHFPRAISIFEGSEVRILGVTVGSVDTVTPSGTDVVVTMHYRADLHLPKDAQAVIVAPSIVGDRFVQLTPVFRAGDTPLADGATLSLERTSAPLELDQIYSSINDLNVALGPQGANQDGALSDLLAVTADNLDGQGAALHQTIEDFSRFSGTLADNREELFGTAAKIEAFLKTLADNDSTVRRFNKSLARVSGMLADERGELAASLKNLGKALDVVGTFVADNRELLGRNIAGLNRVSKVLVKRRDSLDQILRVGPLALNNLALTYNPQASTLDTRANLGQIVNQITSDPTVFLCGIVLQAPGGDQLCDTVKGLLPRSGPFTGGQRSGDRYDPTLGGLLEVTR